MGGVKKEIRDAEEPGVLGAGEKPCDRSVLRNASEVGGGVVVVEGVKSGESGRMKSSAFTRLYSTVLYCTCAYRF